MIRPASTIMIAWLTICTTAWFALPAQAQDEGWSVPVDLSQPVAPFPETGVQAIRYAPDQAFPAIAVDSQDGLHVVWSGGIIERSQAESGEIMLRRSDLLFYRAFRNGAWSPPTDIFASDRSGSIGRNAISAGRDGRLHVLVANNGTISYQRAPWNDALQARAWTRPDPISTTDSYYTALSMDNQGILHAFWTQIVPPTDDASAHACFRCADLFYRRSDNGGEFWSWPVNLSRSALNTGPPQVVIDASDRIHVVWSEGRQTGMYRRSDDAGQTWTNPAILGTADEPVENITLALTDGRDLLAVYSGRLTGQLYTQFSSDDGASWTPPAPMPGIQSSRNQVGSSSIAVDAAGRIHLLLVGSSNNAPDDAHQLLHLTGDATGWSAPTVIMDNPDYMPEWPQIVAANGNRLHAVWFTRTEDISAAQSTTGADTWRYQVWYSRKQLNLPAIPAAPLFTPAPDLSPTPVPVQPSPLPPTPVPTLDAQAVHAPIVARRRPAWELDGLTTIFLALLPVIGMLLIITGLTWKNRRR